MTYNPAIHHRRSIRLKGYDYSQEGLYFITICCYKHACLFGNVVNGEMILNEYGTIACNEWLNTPKIRKNVELDVFAIMPNHIHGIIILNGRGELHSHNNPSEYGNGELHPSVMDGLHSAQNPPDNSPNNSSNNGRGGLHPPDIFTHDHPFDYKKGECNSPLRGPSNNVGAIVRGYKSSVTKQLNLLNIGCMVWQRNYHEHIIRNEKSYQTIAEYILNNPSNWKDDKFYA